MGVGVGVSGMNFAERLLVCVCVCACVCACVRACVRACVCVCVRACVRVSKPTFSDIQLTCVHEKISAPKQEGQYFF